MKSKMLMASTITATAYTIYLICYFIGVIASANGSEEAIGGGIAALLVTPHMILFLIGSIFGWIALILKKSWPALIAAISYSVGTLCFLMYAMFGIPILILGFFGYANQQKLNKKANESHL